MTPFLLWRGSGKGALEIVPFPGKLPPFPANIFCGCTDSFLLNIPGLLGGRVGRVNLALPCLFFSIRMFFLQKTGGFDTKLQGYNI
jgi:hypothetical protein